MRGRVKNLKNVYRTPSNIAQVAFKILSLDSSLNNYYKKAHYLQKSFVNDINLVLEAGSVKTGEWDNLKTLTRLIEQFPDHEELMILTYIKEAKREIEAIITRMRKSATAKVMTLQSTKGLEARHVIIHEFGKFLENSFKHSNENIYRQIYVLLTRAQEGVFLSMDNQKALWENPKTATILQYIHDGMAMQQSSIDYTFKEQTFAPRQHLAKLKPVIHDAKEGAEFIVAASELFALIGGLFVTI